MTRSQKKVLQLIISVVLMAGLLYFVDLDATLAALAGANVTYLVAALVLVLFNRVLMPVKWNILLRAHNIVISWWDATRIYFIASFLGLYLPPTVGSDAVRAYYTSRQRYPLRDVVSSILVERLLGLLALLIFALGGMTLLVSRYTVGELNVERLLVVIAVLAGAATVGFFASLGGPLARRITAALANREARGGKAGKLAKKLGSLYGSYTTYADRKLALFIFFLLTCLEVCLPIVRSYLVGLAIGVDVSLVYYFAFVPIILVLIRLPLSIDGFGLHEGGFVYFLALAGVAESLGFSVGLLNHLVFLLAVLPGGIFYALDRDRRKVLEGAEQAVNEERPA